MERIINSLLDTDYYKLTMGQAVYHHYSEYLAGYEFINRGKHQFPDNFDVDLRRQIEMMADIRLSKEEAGYLQKTCGNILADDYLDWYKKYYFNPDEIKISREKGGLEIDIAGPWERTIYWEVPLMATVSELFYHETGQKPDGLWEERCRQKAITLEQAGARFADFGSRRRFSYLIHEQAVRMLKENAPRSLLGTSNVEMAKKYSLPPIGTFAHEWVMAHSGIFGPKLANRRALEIWAQEFNGKLSTALTDTLTSEVFFQDFDHDLASMFLVCRQDSGIPEEWTENYIDCLRELDIDPLERTALYSDALTIPRVLEILNYNKGRIKSLFGIGTNLTNDVGAIPLNMVIKMRDIQKINGPKIGVCKLSDTPGKVSGDQRAVRETLLLVRRAA